MRPDPRLRKSPGGRFEHGPEQQYAVWSQYIIALGYRRSKQLDDRGREHVTSSSELEQYDLSAAVERDIE